jgi:NAD(P)-dependent dehydrogenase (short-subunit alcohol dehydrogenase family)
MSERDSFSVSGLRVVVTAGGQGIGRAIAERFLGAGAAVAVCDIDQALLDAAQAALPGLLADCADIGDPAQVERFFAGVYRRLGGIDVLVNNAGIGGGHAALEDIAYADWDRTVSVNLNGMFYCIKQVAAPMKRARSGCIINISTASVRTALPFRAPYVASKAGVMGLTHNVARELGAFNIRCNSILPGLMDNDRGRALVQRMADESGRDFAAAEADMLRYISLRSWIDPSEIGDAAIFLASPAGRHITGQSLGVCGNVEWEI